MLFCSLAAEPEARKVGIMEQVYEVIEAKWRHIIVTELNHHWFR